MAALLRHLAKLDIPGGGQVVAEGDWSYVGHMHPPEGTSIIDVADPRRPRIVSQVSLPAHTHSHKVRVHGDIMLVNNELFRATTGERPDDFQGGIKIYDIADRTSPRAIGHYKSLGSHRFDSDGAYAYISSEENGFVGDIVVIRHPKYNSGLDWSPPYPCPTHTVLPIPHELMGRKIAVVTDEEVADRLTPSPNAFMWIVDITDETHPVPVATWRVPHDEPFNRDCWFGAHQPQETVDGNIILVTWFGGGLRAVDIANPYRPEEVASFMPTPGAGQKIVQSNDVFVDQTRGLVYLIDRLNGLDILEYGG